MMMRRLRSIRSKLMWMVLFANCCALLVAGGALLFNAARDYRASLLDELNTQADILGRSSMAALEFNDAETAADNLAQLAAQPKILAAAIYTAKGSRFASYQSENAPKIDLPTLSNPESVVVGDGVVMLSRRVVARDEVLGYVYFVASNNSAQHLWQYLSVIALAMLGSMLVAAAIANRLQRWITRPLFSVTDVARQVLEQRNFSLRATKLTDDEVGYLVDAFNDMLAEIGQRTATIEASRNALEKEIAERREIQKVLQISELRNRTLLEAMSSVVWHAGPMGGFSEVQPVWGEYTGQTSEQYLGLGWRQAFHQDDQAAIDRFWTVAINDSQPFKIDVRLWHASSGRYREVVLRGVPMSDDDGRVFEWIGTINDVDDRRAAEREVLKLNAELEQRVAERTAQLEVANRELVTRTQDAETANRAKAEFLANMSHEIRTPMNAVLGLAYLLEQGSLDANALDLVRKIRNAGRSLQSIINDILDFSKIEANRLEIENAPFKLNDVLENLATIIGTNVGSKDIEVAVSAAHDVPRELMGDSLRLEQVLINLAGNAIKFTEHGSVMVRVEALSQDDARCVLRFSIKDTGIGIPLDKQAQIFTVFSQADASTTRRFGGTGLGLTICRHLVNKMGGEIGVISQPGAGSEFWFTIPFERSLTPDPSVLELANLDILAVDDSDIARESLSHAAASVGWKITAVESGEAALEHVKARLATGQGYDVLLIDWKMPGMDGLTTANKIRQSLKGEPWPIIIMVTSFSRDELIRQADSSTIDEVLDKPVTSSSLYNTVASILRKRRVGSPMSRSQPTRPTIPGVRVLVVDDSEINREVAERILRSVGATVVLAQHGKAAVEWLQAHAGQVDIVLMDVQMPEMDGYQATRLIRQTPELAELPIVALTAGAFKAQQQAAREAGMDDFVAKPFDVGVLIQTIQRLTKGTAMGALPSQPGDDGKANPEGFPTISPPGIDLPKASQIWQNLSSFCKVLRKFERENRHIVSTFETLLAADDRKAATALAHKIKGAAGNLALTEVARIAFALEQALLEGVDVLPLLPLLKSAFDTARVSVDSLCDREATVAPAGLAKIVPERVSPLLTELLSALNTDNPEKIEPVLERLKQVVPAEYLARIQLAVEDFDFRLAETLTRALARESGVQLQES